jgi:hypothetical protein
MQALATFTVISSPHYGIKPVTNANLHSHSCESVSVIVLTKSDESVKSDRYAISVKK